MTAPACAASPALLAIVACIAAAPAWRTFAAPATDADPRVYAGALAPAGVSLEDDQGTPTPYAVASGFTETDFRTMGGAAGDVTGRVRVWCAGGDETGPLVGAGAVRIALADLLIPGYRVCRVDTRLERTLTDPDGAATQATVGVTLVAERLP